MQAKIIPFRPHRKSTNDTPVNVAGSNNNRILVSDFMEEYLRYSESTHTVKTQKHFRTAFREFIRITGDMPLSAVGVRDIEGFIGRKKLEASLWTAAKYYTALSSAWCTAQRWGYVEENIFRSIKKPKPPEATLEYFTKEDFKTLISTIPDKDFRDLVIVAVNTGLRLNELLNLHWKHIDFTDCVIRIQNSETFQTKSKRNRVVPMNKVVLSILSEKSKSVTGDYVF
jgi:integrase